MHGIFFLYMGSWDWTQGLFCAWQVFYWLNTSQVRLVLSFIDTRHYTRSWKMMGSGIAARVRLSITVTNAWINYLKGRKIYFTSRFPSMAGWLVAMGLRQGSATQQESWWSRASILLAFCSRDKHHAQKWIGGKMFSLVILYSHHPGDPRHELKTGTQRQELVQRP